ncbi:unnamed protein product [Penicillium egyptiacum]|uniref:Cytochrome P450 n=1 Tax=Penicillium egyptiacum TaxID=1303716 RepID=A0A9W4KBQ3_9EURO|nr:unnamed protein product [Penicillium egyptiacum]
MTVWSPCSILATYGALAFGLVLVVRTWVRPQRVPPGIQWAGKRPNEFLAEIRACLREYTTGITTMMSAYKKFNVAGIPFLLPTTGFEPQVMLPQEWIKWVVDQPEDILSSRQVQGERLGLNYILPALDITSDVAIIEATRIHLTRNVGKVQANLVDELRQSVDKVFGMNTEEWSEVNVHSAMKELTFKSTGRVLFGHSLTHNEKFMHGLSGFSTWFGIGIILVGQLIPWQFRRFVGSLCALPMAYYRAICTRHVGPVFSERFENMQRKIHDPTFDYSPPEDLITWVFRAAFNMKDQTITNGKPLASRFILLMSGALSSSVAITTHALVDLLGSDPQHNYVELLREESESTFLTEDDWNRSTSLLKLHRLDSVFRESLRRNPPTLRGLSRQVMPKEGVILPNGQKIPQGAWIGVPVLAIQADERFYDQPDVFSPLRFVPTEVAKRTLMVTTSDTFLPFGHARGSCPGRWFASHFMKLLFAYIMINYELEPLEGGRPLNKVVGDHLIPPIQVSIRVRRRALPTEPKGSSL